MRADPDLDAQAVIDHCQGKLARFKMPTDVKFVDQIPRNPTGKALKTELRAMFAGLDSP